MAFRSGLCKLAVLVFSLAIVSCLPPTQDREKLNQIENLWGRFPRYPAMVEIDHSSDSGFGKASIFKSFRCKDTYEEVKKFYLERLSQEGWQLVEERQLKDWGNDVGGRELRFRRADYTATIDYAGSRAGYGWDYTIGIGWNRWVN